MASPSPQKSFALRRARSVVLLSAGLFSSVLAIVACGGSSQANGQSSGDTIGCWFDIGLFQYCSEYRGVSKSVCEQSHGTYYAQCPSNYVGVCEIDANVNPKKTYFYGSNVTAEAAQAVCPGGKYTLGSSPIPTGTAGAGSSSGGQSSSGGHSNSGGSGGNSASNSSGDDCNQIAASSLIVTVSAAAPEDAPELKGGTVSPGTYQLTALTGYGAPDSFDGGQQKGSLSVGAPVANQGVMQSVDSSVVGGDITDYRYSFTYTALASTFVLTSTCGPELTTWPGTFAATSKTLELLLDTPGSGGGSFKLLWHYEKL